MMILRKKCGLAVALATVQEIRAASLTARLETNICCETPYAVGRAILGRNDRGAQSALRVQTVAKGSV